MKKITLKEEEKVIENIFDIVEEELKTRRIKYDYIFLKILDDIRTVGVQGDNRTYLPTLFIRISKDKKHLYGHFLHNIAQRVLNETRCINRVVYDITDPKGKDQGLYF